MPMAGSRSGSSTARVWTCFLLVALLVNMVACSSKTTPTPAVTTAKNAEVGKSLESQDYALTLVDQPYEAKLVGGLVVGGSVGWSDMPSGVKEAEGIWLIIPVKLTNNSEEVRVLSKDAFIVKDAQGREFQVGGRMEHQIHVFEMDRWKSNDNYLVENPMSSGQTREGPLIYDVAKVSTGLRMTGEGKEDSFSLGF